MLTRGYLIEILLHMYDVEHTEVISGFLFTFITHKLWEHLVGIFTVSQYILKVLFNDCDVRTLKIIHSITFRNYAKHQIKVLRNKNNIMYIMNLFIKRFPALHLNIFVANVFRRETFLRYKTKTFYVSLLITWRRVFLQKKVQLGY